MITVRHLSRLAAGLAVSALCALAGHAAMAQDKPGEGVTVKYARATWDTGFFEAEVYKQLLEELGYTVEGPATLENPVFYQSVGQGDLDLWVNGWFPLHNSYEETFSQGAELVGHVVKGGALEGYLVDKTSAEKYNIKTLDDFKRDEVKAAFDRNGDGKADLVACPPGWGCELGIEHHLDAYGLRDHVNAIKAEYSASMADALAAHGDGESIFYYTWTPNWTGDALKPGKDVVWIEVPHTDLRDELKQFEDATVMAGVTGCVADPCNLGFPANDIRPVANSAFLKDNPAVKALLEAASLPIEAIFAQNAEMNDGANSPEDLQKQAAAWIAENRALVDGWLDSARKAAAQ